MFLPVSSIMSHFLLFLVILANMIITDGAPGATTDQERTIREEIDTFLRPELMYNDIKGVPF